VDVLAAGEEFRESGPERWDSVERIGKADALRPRPSEPGGVMPRPLGRHAEAEGGGGGNFVGTHGFICLAAL
jgi:hypothetical protein